MFVRDHADGGVLSHMGDSYSYWITRYLMISCAIRLVKILFSYAIELIIVTIYAL